MGIIMSIYSKPGLLKVAAASVLISFVAAAAIAGTTSELAPQQNPYAPSYGHPYRHGAVPTLEAQARMSQFAALHADAPHALALIDPNDRHWRRDERLLSTARI